MICIEYKDPVIGASLDCFAAAAYDCWFLASQDRQEVLGIHICAFVVLHMPNCMLGLQESIRKCMHS